MRNPTARLIRQIVGGKGPIYCRAKRLYAKTPSPHKAVLLAQLAYQAAVQRTVAKAKKDVSTAHETTHPLT